VKLDIVCRGGGNGSKRWKSGHDKPVVTFPLFDYHSRTRPPGIVCVSHSRVDTTPSPLLSSTFSFLPWRHSSLSLTRPVRCSVSVHRFLGSSSQLPTRVAIQPLFVSTRFLLSLCHCTDNSHFALRLAVGFRPCFTSLWFLSDHKFWLFLLGISLRTHGD
jgi:hypothetical protein